jgi:FemAB-related protein (PEP-CTERM system-associated)
VPPEATIRVDDHIPEEAWTAYVDAHPGASLFHGLTWQRVLQRTFPSYRPCHRIAWRGDRVSGVLPLFRVPSLPFGFSLVSTPLGVYGGVCADDDEVAQALLEDAASFGQKIGAQYVELRQERALPSMPTKDLYFTFRREILPDHEADLQALPSERRRAIRVAMKKGLTCRIGGEELLGPFYEVYTRNMRTLGSPAFPRRLFEALLEHYGPRGGRIFAVYHGDTLTSASYTLFHRDQVMPYYAASTPEGMGVHTNEFMYWSIMRHGAENGFKVIDFGRSKKGSGPYRFKQLWGITPTHLPYQYRLITQREMPNLSPTNPKFAAAIWTWQRTPLSLTRWLGPKLSRFFP